MSITLVNENKNDLTLSLETRGGDLTWDEATMTWDESSPETWDSQSRPVWEKENKSNLTLSLENKL